MLPTCKWLQNRTMRITIQSQTHTKTQPRPVPGPLSARQRGFRGAQPRTFGYNSLARLTGATNPESGANCTRILHRSAALWTFAISEGILKSGTPNLVDQIR
jgi:hypothetical protein